MRRRNQHTLFTGLFVVGLFVLGILACASNGTAASGDESRHEGEKSMSDKGTKVKLVIGETIIPAVLNDSKPARALLAKLPYSVKLQRYEHDYCGVMSETLPYDAAELRSGWKNGDIAFAVNGNYFAILYKDEEISQQYDGMVTMGALDCSPSVMETLAGSISVSIEQD
ncbi:hypothetical protein GM415_09040 [Pseudodesulfovibrio cashew]|uniref:Cyclophilin-like domain-containing protein n=2 Tax=Pseudodesulfovibrio cashew TaxID=2678688 RepID=A0A6I6JBW4_9BACT|nr:hypothetical protein GM415_09040 [Pseudodesulfovibrio cashew]